MLRIEEIKLSSFQMKHFCTIITSDHLPKTYALFDSLCKFDKEVCLHTLVINDRAVVSNTKNLVFYQPNQLSHLDNYGIMTTKYGNYKDKLRWSLKSLFLQHLLQTTGDKVIYTDTDIYFFGAYNFLFELLDGHNVLLTPHYYSIDPTREQNWFEANFRVGLYNAGFVGVNQQSFHLLRWWASCCAYRCEKNALRGTFDDQKYLDLLPIMDENVHILRHKGCNVADWNVSEIKRTMPGDNVILADKYPLIFIHFNNTTIRSIAQGKEPLLEKYLKLYFENLKKYKPDLQLRDMYKENGQVDKLKYRIWKVITGAGFTLL